jgi:hypothetical protein
MTQDDLGIVIGGNNASYSWANTICYIELHYKDIMNDKQATV